DTWHPRKIEQQLETLCHHGPAYGVCYTLLEYQYESGRPGWLTHAAEEGELRAALMTSNVVGSTSSIMARRDLLITVGGFTPTLRACQDWDLWCRLLDVTKFACAAEVLTTIRLASDGRISSSGRGRLSGHFFMYRRHLRPYFKARSVNPTLFLTTL